MYYAHRLLHPQVYAKLVNGQFCGVLGRERVFSGENSQKGFKPPEIGPIHCFQFATLQVFSINRRELEGIEVNAI